MNLKCDNCSIKNTKYFCPIKGIGNNKASILVIFDSPKGDFIQQDPRYISIINILNDIDFPLSDFYFAYKILCHPQENSVVNCENIHTYIEGIKPKTVLSVGANLLFYFTGKKAINLTRGKLSDSLFSSEYKVFPIFSPDNIINNKHKLESIVYDLRKLKNILYPPEQTIEGILIETIDQFKEFFEYISNKKVFAFDVESTGKRIYVDKIIGMSFSADYNKGFYLPLRVRKENELVGYFNDADTFYILSEIKKLLEDKNHFLVGQNFTFDRKMMFTEFGINVNNAAFDTLISAHALDENADHKLGAQSSIFPDMLGHKEELRGIITQEKQNNHDYSNVPLEVLSKYGIDDAVSTYRLALKHRKDLKDTPMEGLVKNISIPFANVIFQMESTGVRIDLDLLNENKETFKKDIDDIEEKIYELANEEFNINSTQQLGKILFEKLKLDNSKSKKTKTGWCTDVKVMSKLVTEHEIAKYILKQRGLSKLLKTYVVGLEKNIINGKVYGSFNQSGPVTGRLSSSNPNLQNISGKEKVDIVDVGLNEYRSKIRPMFIPDEGYKFIDNDYSQLELRLLAWLSQDPVMMDIYKTGKDIHFETMQTIFSNIDFSNYEPKDDFCSPYRKKAKTVNFGIVYGMSVYALMNKLNEQAETPEDLVTKEMAASFINSIYSKYSNLTIFKNNVYKELKEREYVEHVYGRRRRFPGYNRLPDTVMSKYGKMIPNPTKEGKRREAVNFYPQGIAAEKVKIAAVKCLNECKEAIQIIQVHDQILSMAKEDRAEQVLIQLKEIMERPEAPIDIPFIVDGKILDRWQ